MRLSDEQKSNAIWRSHAAREAQREAARRNQNFDWDDAINRLKATFESLERKDRRDRRKKQRQQQEGTK